jgi:gliding motility-associated-like protein
MQRVVLIGLFIWLIFAEQLSAQKLIINEVSNGPSGNKEYVELVVVDTTVVYDCTGTTTPPCIDIRGWIFDDNSGYHGGSGVAAGCMRFSNNAIWSCVPVGTIILIYYNSDRNALIPADDVSLSDGNCRIVAPDNNATLFEQNNTTPGAVACSYPASGWNPGGSWNNTLLANPGDCARIVNLSGCEVFSLCWGSDNTANLIYFAGSGAGRCWYFNSGDPTLQANWSQGAAGTNETPGAANNAANQAYINQFNNGCSPITPLSVTGSSANSGCSCTGTASVTASGSTAPYTYTWSNGAATSSISGLCAGVYTVTVESAIHCTQTLTFTITATGSPNANAGSAQTLTCTSPTATLSGSSTTPGATFGWTGPGIVSGGSTATPTVNAAGTYTLTVTVGGCTATSTVSVTSNTTTPNVSIAAHPPLTCATNTVALVGSSTTPGVTFQWTGGPAASNYTVSATGGYTLTVTNPASGCTASATSAVSSNTTPPNASIAAPATLTCAATTVTLAGSSTTPGATFQWTGGPATANYGVTSPGTYTLTVTSPANGCTNTVTATVSSNTATPNASIAAPASLSCATTTVTLTGSSTTPGATFQWTGGPATANYPVTAAGIYTLTVTNPANGCTGIATTTVTNTASTPNVSIATPTQLTCATTTLTLNGSSTTPGVSYSWSGAGIVVGGSTATPSVNAAGIYTLTVTDAGSCTNTATVSVTSSTTTPNISIAAPAQLTCTTTTVTLAGSSTTPGATFQWTSGPATANYTVTTAGVYTLTVTDPSNGCTNTATTTVTSNTATPNVSIAAPVQLTCTTTTVTLAGSSTTAGAAFQWTSGPAAANDPVTTAGIYTLTVTDPSNGCTSVATATVTSNTAVPNVSIAPPSTLTCTTATVTLNGSSTTAGATFQWTSGPAAANYAVTAGGTYTLTVTDPSNGCTSATTTTVASSIVLPDVSIGTPASLTCTTGTVTLTGSSITAGVTYQWTSGPAAANYPVTTAGIYTLTVTDPSNSCTNTATVNVTSDSAVPDASIAPPAMLTCVTLTSTLSGSSSTPGVTYQWTSGPASVNYTVAATGTYTLTVTDPGNGCTNTVTATVGSNTAVPDVSIAPPAALSCTTTTVTLTGSSTASGVQYQWTSGPATATYEVSTAGIYSLTVTDPSNGCANSATVTVVNTGAFPDISISPPDTITCLHAFVTIAGSSTTSGVNYQWLAGGPASPVNTVATGGTYTLTVTDPSNGCISTATVDVISSTALPNVSIASPGQLNCTTASIALNGSSTTPGVVYQWTGGPATASYTVTTAGVYTLTVTNNSNGCVNTATTTVISNSTIPDLTIAVPPVITCTNPTATLIGFSSVSGLTYQWTGGPGMPNYPVSTAGTYTLTANNPANGCSNTASVTVTSNATAPDANFSTATVRGCAPVCISLTPSMAVSPAWQYTWTFSNGLSINGYHADTCFDQSGIYDASLSVSDPTNGCSASYTVTSVAEVYPVPDAAFSYNPSNPSTSDPMVVFINESTNADTYVWNFGDDSTSTLTNPVWSFDIEGDHPVMLYAQNSFGCVDSIVLNIYVEGEFAIYVPNAFSPGGDLYNETWRPLGVGVDENDYELSIFDRWGMRIFHTRDWENGAWDGRFNGTPVQVDTYIYKIKVSPKIRNGQDGRKELNGQLHVIR